MSGSSPQPAQKTQQTQQNTCIVVAIIAVMVACIALIIITNNQQAADEATAGVDPILPAAEDTSVPVSVASPTSIATVIGLDDAATSLNIAPAASWDAYEFGEITVFLPARLEPLSDSEVEAAAARYGWAGIGPNIVLLAVDTTGSNFQVQRFPNTRPITLEQIVDDTVVVLRAGGYIIQSQKLVEIGERDVGEIWFLADQVGRPQLIGVQYIVLRDNAFWVIVGTTFSTDAPDWMPVFRQIMRQIEFH